MLAKTHRSLPRRFLRHLIVFLGSYAGLTSSGSAGAPPPVEAFARPPAFSGVEISPNGEFAAARSYLNGHYKLTVFTLGDSPKASLLNVGSETESVEWFWWKTDQSLLVGTATMGMFAVSRDGHVQHKLKDGYVAIASLLPQDSDHVLVSVNDRSRLPRLYKVELATGKALMTENIESGVFQWLVDQTGVARVGRGWDDGKLNERFYFRDPESGAFHKVIDRPIDSEAVFEPVMIDKTDPDILYVKSSHEGNTIGLYRYRISTRSFMDRIFLRPDVDVDSFSLDPTGTEINGVNYITSEFKTEWFDPRPANALREVRNRVAARQLYIASASLNYRRFIIYAESPDQPGKYYFYEPETGRLLYFAWTFPELDKQPLGFMRSTSFQSRDGLEIPAYLTLPPGIAVKPTKPLPAIVFPHGGPQRRDVEAFDPLVQLFATRGWAVLQMNFRGSEGYGTEFKKAGAHQWGQAMQDDVTDGTKWLIQQGIADPSRICIVGWSYGGYAALMGAVKEPELYRCAVSIAGVSNLPRLLARSSRIATRYVGDYRQDAASLAKNSPAKRAAEIRIPVLLAHGTSDETVPIEQSKLMGEALENAGKEFVIINLKGADHSVLDAAPRYKLFSGVDSFLSRYLNPSVP